MKKKLKKLAEYEAREKREEEEKRLDEEAQRRFEEEKKKKKAKAKKDELMKIQGTAAIGEKRKSTPVEKHVGEDDNKKKKQLQIYDVENLAKNDMNRNKMLETVIGDLGLGFKIFCQFSYPS